jgi:hypothetical protein
LWLETSVFTTARVRIVSVVGFEPVLEVAGVMHEYEHPWFVSGGWAIDLFVGRVTREHEDIEVGAFVPDQTEIRRYLGDWALHRPEDGQWLPLEDDGEVRLPEFQIQARSSTRPPHQFDVFLNPLDGDQWVSRRHAGLRVPVRNLYRRTTGRGGEPAGVPYLVPEIQLLYKAKSHRPKDDADFVTALPLLGRRRRAWLRAALVAHHPDDPWLDRL